MKILHISPRFRAGGAERCARELFEYQIAQGHDVQMYTAVPEQDTPKGIHCIRSLPERLGYPLNFLPTINDWRHIGSKIKLSCLTQKNFDVVHLHNLHGNWISIKSVASLCKRIPSVWTLHDEWAINLGMPYDLTRHMLLSDAKRLSQEAGLPQRVPICPGIWSERWGRFLRNNMPSPQCVITTTSCFSQKCTQLPWLKNAAVKYIPYGLTLLNESNINADKILSKKYWNLPQDNKTILLIAADLASPFKGIPLAIRAINQLDNIGDMIDKPSVLILGKNAGKISEKINRSFTVATGYAANSEDLAMAYRACDLTLIPSVAEAFGYVVTESFACQREVIAFDANGPKELVEKVTSRPNKYLVDNFDCNQLAQILRDRLTEEESHNDFGEKAKKWVAQNCNMPHYIDQIFNTYKQAQDLFYSK